MPIELDRAVDVAVVDQQLRAPRRCPAAALIASLNASASKLRPLTAMICDADRHAGVERGAVPQDARDLAVVADHEPARIGRSVSLRVLLARS